MPTLGLPTRTAVTWTIVLNRQELQPCLFKCCGSLNTGSQSLKLRVGFSNLGLFKRSVLSRDFTNIIAQLSELYGSTFSFVFGGMHAHLKWRVNAHHLEFIRTYIFLGLNLFQWQCRFFFRSRLTGVFGKCAVFTIFTQSSSTYVSIIQLSVLRSMFPIVIEFCG